MRYFYPPDERRINPPEADKYGKCGLRFKTTNKKKFSHRLTQINTGNKKYKSVKSVKSVAKSRCGGIF
jgi:hypothetical protein